MLGRNSVQQLHVEYLFEYFAVFKANDIASLPKTVPMIVRFDADWIKSFEIYSVWSTEYPMYTKN